jgi:hypothetical protein
MAQSWMDRFKDKQTYRHKRPKQTDNWMDRWMNRQTDVQTDRQMNRRTDEWMDGRTDE